MNSSPHDDFRNDLSPAEETLRLIANLPAPAGLAERVQSTLRNEPKSARVLRWPIGMRPMGGWMHSTALRGAAAAAIVCVVAGGGWRIYSRVQPAPTAKAIAMPARVGGAGGFSSANAMRTPDPTRAPVHTHAAPVAQVPSEAVEPSKRPAHKGKVVKAQKPVQPAAAVQ